MPQYPFDESKVAIDRQSFEVLSNYFQLVEGYQEGRGYGCFIFDRDTVESLATQELLELSPFLFAHSYGGFQGIGEKISSAEILKLMKKQGITGEVFLNRFADFEYHILGDESAQFISAIAADLSGEARLYGLQTSGFSADFQYYRKHHEQYSQSFEEKNQRKKKPYHLKYILTFEHEPVALRYSSNGELYVLDQAGQLHEFKGKKETHQWKIPIPDYILSDSNFIDVMGINTRPNIAVENNTLFLTTKSQGLQRFDLEHLLETETMAMILYQGRVPAQIQPQNILIHDVIIKEGNVLVSVSGKEGRSIIQVKPNATTVIHQGYFPKRWCQNNFEDYTLRLGLHQGHLYFPEGEGLSRLTAEGTIEMLPEIIQNNPYDAMNPVTKFAFGDNFMVSYATVKGFEFPLLCLFSLEYDAGLTSPQQIAPPSQIKLFHRGYPPRFTGHTLQNASLSAHAYEFAITNSSFKRVFVYGVVKNFDE